MSNTAKDTGVFITFEGGEGAGKTTHINFLAEALGNAGREVVCLREPGGTAVGEALRAVVLDPAHGDLCPRSELLIYEAARAQIVEQVIRPALERGAVVLCDRFFDSTTAYQGYGRQLPLDFIDAANRFATDGLVPDRTLLMTTAAPVEVGLQRATHHGEADRLEQAGISFHARVREGFQSLAAAQPERFRVIASSSTKARTARSVFTAVADLLGWDPQNLPFDDAFFERADRKRTTGKAVVGKTD